MCQPSALRQCFDEYADRLLLVARCIGEPAEDAVQEAFIALTLQPSLPGNVFAWLVNVTRNRLLGWHRSDKRRRQREQFQQLTNWFEGDVQLVDRRLDAITVTAALQALPQEQRESIVMHLWGNMTFEQIANITNESRSTAHRHFSRGLETLRSRFDAAGAQSVHLLLETQHDT